MDIDHNTFNHYRSIFPDDKKFPFSKERISRILRNRSLLDGKLFFDIVLSTIAHVDDINQIYPPKNVTGLRLLIHTIEEKEELDRLKKSSFVYYLLKDFDRAHPGNGFATQYANKVLIPPNFCSLMDGLYALDNFDFEDAVGHLTEPSVIPVEPHKVLSTLVSHAGPNGPRLATTFVQTVQPVLDTDTSINDYFRALRAISIESAFLYQRTVPLRIQPDLFKSLIDYCLTVKKESNALKLINLPFTPEEQEIFESYIQDSSIPAAHDTLITRQMHQGQLTEALLAARSAHYQNEPELEGVNWAGLARGLSLGIGPREG
ncbi:uncharacterized protein H6S33_012845 [Morchella sextelata]|uniref:uncharacterized protein n=1 Tax=Morchella sextelata TaxID=1174677 RepID=UPI001D0500C3|nr:uncharacterized protein H6S33_012845 [Morchella sextelata]KAH0609359.1 hypothetical protein H6S33_012845 [Morchella sextelata]